MNTIIESPAVERIHRHRAAGAVARRTPVIPAIAARKRASEALGRAALVFLMGAGFALGAVLPMKAKAAPYGSAPIAVPAIIAAEHFDRGGEGVGYHDISTGNAGAQFRANENVDLVALPNGGYAVNNFQTGEWLAYTIKVPTSGRYDIDILASTTHTNSSFHIGINGRDVTGPVTIPSTGGWNAFRWVGKPDVSLRAGTHVLKVFSNQEYFNLNSIRISRSTEGAQAPRNVSTPYSGTPAAIPGIIRAEWYDRGGPGVGYHDMTARNSGKAYRAEDVDIINASTSGAGSAVVNNIQTGEWLKYTVDVAATRQYDISLRVSSAVSTGAFHVQVDGTNVTGSVPVPDTGGWTTYRWVTKRGVTLRAGKQALKVVADGEYFNFDEMRIAATNTTPPSSQPGPTPQAGSRQFFCTFQSSPGECGFGIQAKSSTRVSIVDGGRDGSTAVRLRTMPGDDNVFGSGSSERADLSLSQSNTNCSQGKEAWWAHSVMFPSDYVSPTNGFGVVMDFHHTGSSGQANFHVDASRWDGKLHFRGYGGSQDNNEYGTVIGNIVKNHWYDFVYHVRWSSGSDGFMKAWVNGQKKLDHRGPTLYSGQGCYLKLANYHSPFGQASAVIHDRVIRGSTWQAVSRTTLEGVE